MAIIVTVLDESYIMSGILHASLTGVLLLGIYTVIYLGTMFICLTAKGSRNPLVLTAITFLYILNVISITSLWENIHLLLGTSGESKTKSLLVAAATIDKEAIITCITQTVPLIIADGLLIWRCYRIWNNSLCIIALSLVAFLAETALNIYVMTILIADQVNNSTTSNKALSAGFFLAVGVTLWTTTLIAYRIYSTSNHIIQKHSKTRFTNVLEILVQSSAMYSVILLANALLTAIPENSSNIWTIGYISDIFGVMLHAITGIAPSLMVCRVTLASSSEPNNGPTTVNVSGIDFGVQNPIRFEPGSLDGVEALQESE